MTRHLGRAFAVVLGVVLALGVVAPAFAVPVVVSIRATVTNSDGPFAGVVNAGDTVTGYYIYDTETPDGDPSTESGWYDYTRVSPLRGVDPPYGISLTVNGLHFKTNPARGNFWLSVVNSSRPLDDYWVYANTCDFDLTVEWEEVNYIQWSLQDETGSALSSDALPALPLDLSQWGYNSLEIVSGYVKGSLYGAYATVTGMEVVPGEAIVGPTTPSYTDPATGVTVDLGTVIGSGAVMVDPIAPAHSHPSSFRFLANSYFDISTTAEYTGPITITFPIPDDYHGDERSLNVLHWEWVEAKGKYDWVPYTPVIGDRTVTITVDSLSDFVLAEYLPPTTTPAAGPLSLVVLTAAGCGLVLIGRRKLRTA